MFKLFMDWYQRRFSDPNAIALTVVLILLFIIIYFFHTILAPLLIAIVLSYLLEKPVSWLTSLGFARTIAVTMILFIFLSLMLLIVAILLPLIWQQITDFVTNIPTMLTSFNYYLSNLPEKYPELMNISLFDTAINNIKNRAIEAGNSIVQFSISSLFSFISILINAVIIPIIIFFLLKDKQIIMDACWRYLPKDRNLMLSVANTMNQQISNYIEGTFSQIIILTTMIYVPFYFFELDYGLLLAVAAGVSIIIPYVGMVIASLPVVLVALFQWGISTQFGYFMATYLIIGLINGNIVVPILFSEALNLHPLVIIVAIIIFGGLWGFWGVFFSIPLATLIKAIIISWPIDEKTNQFNE